MKIYHRLAQADAGGPGSAVALGFFDGVHIGHRSVIGAAVSAAAAGGLTAGVFTFRLPLSSHLKGGRLQTEEGKHQVMERLGVQLYLEPPFEEVCGQSPEEFVELVLEKALRAKAVFCGDNFTFGKKAAGNVDTLRRLCGARGIRVVQVEMARWQGEKVSSSRIRAALEAGDIPAANAMLGRPYAIDFEVAHGKGLGHTLRTAADLIDAGADSARITNDLFETVSRKRMTLENRIMDTLEYHFDDRCATIVMSRALLDELGAKVEDLEGIVSIPRRIEGVDVAVAFRENPSGTYKISVRTGEKANASAICENFGGGGHVRAAGCNVPGPLEHAKELLLEAVRKELTGA